MKSLLRSGRILCSINAGKLPQPYYLCRRPLCASSDELAVENEVLGIVEQVNPMEPALDQVTRFLTRKVVTSVLQQKMGNLELGFRFFNWVSGKKHLHSWRIQNLVVDMLVRNSCNGNNLEGFDLCWKALDDVRKCDGSIHPDVFTALISAYWKIKNAEMAVETFSRMVEFNCKRDVLVFNTILYVLVKKGVILLAMAVYNVIMKTNCQPNCSTFNILIDGLCKAGKTGDALNLFDEMSEKGVLPSKTTYTEILSGFCRANRPGDAYRHFNMMKSSGCVPDNVTYNTLLNGFCKLGKIEEAVSFLFSLKKDGFVGTLQSYSCLVDGLVRANRIDEAEELFQKILETRLTPDLVLYTIMMRGLSQVGRVKDALNLLTHMTERGIVPDTHCYNTLIKGLCNVGLLHEAQSLKLEISEQDLFPDTCTYTILICGMCKHGMMDEASNLFNEMEKIGCFRSVVTFNTLIHGLCMDRKVEEAKHMLYEMEVGKSPSLFLRLSQGADRVHDIMDLKRLCEAGQILKAYKLLMQLADSGVLPDIITYNTLINGFCKAGNINVALSLFVDLQDRGLSPDKITYGTIIDGLQRAGREVDAFKVFNQMSRNSCSPGPEVYNSLMTWSCRNLKISLAFDLWLKYLKDIRGEEDKRIRPVQNYLKEENFEMAIRALLEIDYLSRSFDSAPYTIWLIGFCQAHRTQEALKLFSILQEHCIKMSGPSCVMLINSLCLDGNLDEAIRVFRYTTENGFQLNPPICNKLLQCLLQSEEKAEKAYDLLNEMNSMGYNLDACLYVTTKTLLGRHSKLKQLEYLLHG